ncbi:ribosomal protein L5 domain-containing protein [Artemisia annua]|uniref:Ribosomal protein L5 domain-containing protein n=1 Tax=Artemisia annua TaxID=35608 RepID=A0A2U1KM90_ARTAN|nr:ribosomal protein L5 domain-containing protein [Artemisia annua]
MEIKVVYLLLALIIHVSIQFLMEMEFCEFSPELEDHFEIFEHIPEVVCWLQSPNREGINNDDLLRYFGVNGLRSIGVSRKTP